MIASSALTAVNAPAGWRSREEKAREVFARAVQRDAHVIKFADTAVDVFARTGNPGAISAAFRAAELTELRAAAWASVLPAGPLR